MNVKFNTLREQYQGCMIPTNEMHKLIKENLPTANVGLLLTELVKHGALIRVKRGTYTFPEKPVHINILKDVYKKVKGKSSGYSKKYYHTHKTPIIPTVAEPTVDKNNLIILSPSVHLSDISLLEKTMYDIQNYLGAKHAEADKDLCVVGCSCDITEEDMRYINTNICPEDIVASAILGVPANITSYILDLRK